MANARFSCGKSFIVGVIYSTPDKDVNEFTSTTRFIVQKLKKEKKPYICLDTMI